ncbi:hypothetical protein P781_13900 [Vibrio mimicus CAIM 1883]|nr:hypothetical protein P780_13880 [Vibrio mimicus CAIM 1882]ERM54408.1 hypothetical protein P781_13900 [Vibrio mimicus CAIM 1883]
MWPFGRLLEDNYRTGVMLCFGVTKSAQTPAYQGEMS